MSGKRSSERSRLPEVWVELDPASPTLLTLEVARRHYLDGWSKVEISTSMGLSRFKVARLLERARENGWVRIEIQASSDVDTDLSDALRERFDLRQAVVVRHASDGLPRLEVASAAARLLEEILTGHDLLGLAWSRTVASMVDRIDHVSASPVVQLTGALPQADPDGGSIELVRRFAGISGAPAYLYYAPMILTSVDAAAAMRQQPEVARTIALLPEVTVAVVAIGGWAAGASTIHDGLPAAECQALAAEGVVAEISGVLVHRDGHPVTNATSERILSPDATQLAAVPHVMALSAGDKPAHSIAAALRTGIVDTLVIDAGAAARVVEVED